MRCLALDIGERRTGVAVGEILARPLKTLSRRSKAQDYAAIAELIRENQVDTLVVGLPLNMDGSKGEQAEWTIRYAGGLKQALDEMQIEVEMVYWDERLTTQQAQEALLDSGRGWLARRARVDAVAAAVILQGYLDRVLEDK